MKSHNAHECAEKRRRVLIADDSAKTRNHLMGLLEMLPRLEVVGEAKDGLEAVETLNALKPDVLILDIEMPKKNGLEVLRQTPNRNCTVIVLTGMGDDFYREKCLELHAQYFFDKINDFDQFVTLLQKL
jgi:DNA-binding NarL/FixJ family response regulator